MDVSIQEENVIMDPNEPDPPTADVIGKFVEYFQGKIFDDVRDPGECVNFRTALASIYKRKFNRIGACKVNENGSTEGSVKN